MKDVNELQAGAETDAPTIPCITLWNPWASWVALGWKKIETRTHARFASLAGKRIGIHAGLKWDMGAVAQANHFLSLRQIDSTQRFLKVGGHVLCTAMVKEARWLTPDDSKDALIECNTKRFGLILDDIQIVPVSDASCVKGAQGIFRVSAALANAGSTKEGNTK